jgi:oligosaccharide repeat unit polymerase
MLLAYAAYTMLGIGLLIMSRLYTRGDIANFLREPVSLTMLALAIIHSFVPLFQFPLGVYRYSMDGYPLTSHVYSVVLTVVFALTVAAAYSVVGPRQQYQMPAMIPMSSSSKAWLYVFMIVPGLLSAGLFYYIVGALGYENFMRDRITFSSTYGGLWYLISRWLYISAMVAFAGFLASRSKGLLVTSLVLGVLTILYFGFIGSRNAIFVVFMTTMGIYFLAGKSKRFSLMRLLVSKYAMIVGVLFVGMVVVGQLRLIVSGQERGGRNTFDAIVETVNGAFGNHENVLWLLSNDFDLEYGNTYFAAIVSPVPRMFWPDKPVGSGPVMKNLVDPGSYEVGKSGITSLTTGMLTESYLNGGMIGVIVVGALTGFLLRLIASLRRYSRGPWYVSIYCYTAVTASLSFAHNEFLGAYLRWLIDVVPMAVGFLLSEINAEEPSEDTYLDPEALYAREPLPYSPGKPVSERIV